MAAVLTQLKTTVRLMNRRISQFRILVDRIVFSKLIELSQLFADASNVHVLPGTTHYL